MTAVHQLWWQPIGSDLAVPIEFLGADGIWHLLYIDAETCVPVIRR